MDTTYQKKKIGQKKNLPLKVSPSTLEIYIDEELEQPQGSVTNGAVVSIRKQLDAEDLCQNPLKNFKKNP